MSDENNEEREVTYGFTLTNAVTLFERGFLLSVVKRMEAKSGLVVLIGVAVTLYSKPSITVSTVYWISELDDL